MELPKGLLDLLHQPALCYVTTLMPDGSPHITQVWVDTDDEHVVINTVEGFQKVRNIRRDPRVAVAIGDPANPRRYYAVRGRVLDVTSEGGREHIDKLSHKYFGGPYPGFGPAGQEQIRLVVTIAADKVRPTD